MSTVPIAPFDLEVAGPSPECGEEFLAQAFASFAGAAASLERSYAQLQTEVVRLRAELEQTNRDLAASLEQNQRTRERLHAIVEGLPCGVLVADREGVVSLANPEARRLLGDGRIVPATITDLFRQVQPGGSELERHTGETQSSWVALRQAPLNVAADGSSILILQDVSGLKRLQLEHEALRRQQALAEMSGVLAHEIRNPLGSLELFAGLLCGSDLSDEQRPWVEHLQAGLRMLAATVNNVLHFHSRTQPGFAPTNLGEWLGALCQFLAPLAHRSRARVELLSGLEGVCVAADRDRLQQVVLNIALNSFRFMPDGGCLRISGGVCTEDRAAWVEFADSGTGIAAKDLERVFEPRFTTRPGSPGLGLAVCKMIVEQHQGTIQASSQPGQGTVIALRLPLWRTQS